MSTNAGKVPKGYQEDPLERVKQELEGAEPSPADKARMVQAEIASKQTKRFRVRACGANTMGR